MDPGRSTAAALVVGGLGMAIVGYGLYVVTQPRARPTFDNAPPVEVAAPTAPARPPPKPAEPAAPTALSLPPPGSSLDPNTMPEATPAIAPSVPEPPELSGLQRRSVAAFLKNDPEQIAPERLEQRAAKALERLDKLPDPPLRPGGEAFMAYMGIWDEIDRMRAAAAYLSGEAGARAGVDTERYATTRAELDAMYADGQKRWRARQRGAAH